MEHAEELMADFGDDPALLGLVQARHGVVRHAAGDLPGTFAALPDAVAALLGDPNCPEVAPIVEAHDMLPPRRRRCSPGTDGPGAQRRATASHTFPACAPLDVAGRSRGLMDVLCGVTGLLIRPSATAARTQARAGATMSGQVSRTLM
jgi:hypothetical protein